MFEELLIQQNIHWTGELYPQGIERSSFPRLLEFLETGQIVAITGVRRSGKSTLIKQLINYLIQTQNIDSKQILFLNLEHPYLSPFREDPTIIERIFQDYLKLMLPKGDLYLFLDEVQFFREWPVFVKAHHETKRVHFVVTGSNAVMLSTDMVTLLSGRSLPLEIFPLSFRELALSRNIPIKHSVEIFQQAPRLKHLLEEFLEYGGYPTVVLGQGIHSAFEILGAHARTVLLQDVAPRLGVRKPADLEKLYVYLVSNIGKLFSYTSLSKVFGLSDKSIKEYVQALCGAHLIYEIDMFSYSLKHQVRSSKKVYAIDTGQANAMGFKFSANRGRLLENLIFIDLKRLGLETYYFRTETNREVDFVVKSRGDLALIQVAWDLSNSDTKERELKSLRESMEALNCKQGIVIVAESMLPKEELEEGILILSAHYYLSLSAEERKSLIFYGYD